MSAITRPAATAGNLSRLALALGLSALPVLLGNSVVGQAAALAGAPGPGSAWLAFGAVPVVALSATVLAMAPGLLLALAIGRGTSAVAWVFSGFLCSLVSVSVASGVLQAIVGESLRGAAYAAALLAMAAVAAGIAARRVRRGAVPWPLATAADRRDLLALAVFWAVAATLLAPKLLWESFNGDGAHAFESSRLLLRHAVPFWPADAGPVAGFPGITSMLYAFPNAWFLRLFGEVEYAARVPLLLYVPVLACGLRGLADADQPDPGEGSSLAMLALLGSAAAYLLAMAYSATYSPYSADMALPGTQDTLLMIVYVGALAASIRREWGWLALGVALTYVSLPSGLLLIGFWLVARVLVQRPVPWREVLAMGGLLVATMAVAAAAPRLLMALGAAPPGGEYGVFGILKYFAFLNLTDVARLAWVAIPAGLLPVAALFLWRRQDAVARALTLVTLAYFLFFYVQAHVSLHHFVPAMVLPMAVAWRMMHAHPAGPVRPAPWALASAVAMLLAFPWGRAGIHRDGREVGRTITVTIPGYAESGAAVMRASTVLDRLFPFDWDGSVPAAYGGSPLVWNHYARHAGAPDAGTNYLVQPSDVPAPAGWTRAGADSTGATVYVRDEAQLARDRARRPATPAGAPLLRVPRATLFHSVALAEGARIIDVAATLKAMGLDPAPLLDRLGARRRG